MRLKENDEPLSKNKNNANQVEWTKIENDANLMDGGSIYFGMFLFKFIILFQIMI